MTLSIEANNGTEKSEQEQLIQRQFYQFYEEQTSPAVLSTKISNQPDLALSCQASWPSVYSRISNQVCHQVCPTPTSTCSNNDHSTVTNLANFHHKLHPCKYDRKRDDIYCLWNEQINMKTLFQDISDYVQNDMKHFKRLYLSNANVKSLESNIFNKITFDEIHIYRCNNLESIDNDAFDGTDQVTSVLSIKFNPKLKPPGNTLFQIIRKFVNLKKLTLGVDNLPVVPSDAFKPTNQLPSQLTEIEFLSNYGQSSWKVITKNAFASLGQLNKISFTSASLDTVEEYAFASTNKSTARLTIDFTNSMGHNIKAFKPNCLAGINRPVTLLLGTPHDETHQKILNYLDEKVFSDFVEKRNDPVEDYRIVDLFNSPINCSDCRNYWLIRDNLFFHVNNLHCLDGLPFQSEDHFKMCHS